MVAILKMPKPAQLDPTDVAEGGMHSNMTISHMSIAHEPTGAERRMFARKEVHAHLQGKRLDHTIPARREPFLSLSLRDLSIGGCSAISQSAVQRGERVSVFFPPQGVHRGWDALGRVIRCEPSGFGYRIAVEFDAMPMAA